MTRILRIYTMLVHAIIELLLRVALALDRHERWAVKTAKRLRGSLLRLWRRWTGHAARHPRSPRGRTPWNRTPPETELAVLRMHHDHRDLGSLRLRALLRRALGIRLARETVRKILRRGPPTLDPRLAKGFRERHGRIDVDRARHLWGMDLTLVWLLGFFPVWLLGAADYHGSRVMTLERLAAPTAANVRAALERAFERHGVPERVLTDNGTVFKAGVLEDLLRSRGVEHTFTRPAHPWTNGRIERLFRTFKQTVFAHIWLFASLGEIDRYCRDFVQFYNRDRPHSRFDDRTPDEVYFGRTPTKRPLGRVTYFDGHLHWYRFG
jgi:transposase InsO family protein